jgi:uncharacterized protein
MRIDMAKTASELSTDEIGAYRPWVSMEHHRKDPEVSVRKDEAWRVAQVVARMLKESFKATRVVAFGSLVREGSFTLWSDIDLAVWGIPPEEYYGAAGTAMDIGLENGIKVDVVDSEDCEPQFLVDIEKEGIDL